MKHAAVTMVLAAVASAPAMVDSELYLRGYRYLYCIAEK